MSTDKFPTVAEVLADLIADRPPEWVAACELVAMVHITRDRATWTGQSYWDQLPARVLISARAASTLPEWWQQMVTRMGCGHPSRTEDRQHLARLLTTSDDTAVLHTLDTERDALAVTVRAAWDIHFGARRATAATQPDEPAQEAML